MIRRKLSRLLWDVRVEGGTDVDFGAPPTQKPNEAHNDGEVR